jgi:nucleoside-diphosphate-sugar epimerase
MIETEARQEVGRTRAQLDEAEGHQPARHEADVGARAALALTVVVTGAGGFLGGAVCQTLLARGHRVRALLRSGPAAPGVAAFHRDLVTDDLGPALEGCDVVIHAAGAVTGSWATMTRDTVAATTRLLLAMQDAPGTPRLVLTSSLAVYAAGEPGAAITETSPLEPEPARRDGYTRSKLAQERLARDMARSDVWLLRIGRLWSRGRMSGDVLGPRLGPLRVRVAEGSLPVCHVAHAALACALACERPARRIEVVNVLDADRPDARRWLSHTGERAVPIPWRVLDAAAGRLAGAPGVPGLLRRPALRARMMRREWPLDQLQDRLGWTPLGGFEEMVARNAA